MAKVIVIYKPGKPANDPASYRPMSLPRYNFKLFERRTTPLIEEKTPMEQAGFQRQRNTTEQVLDFTKCVEAGFEMKKKTGAAFTDLSAAYDTVWHRGSCSSSLR